MLLRNSFLCIVLFAGMTSNSTDTIPKKIVAGLEFWSKNNPVEKVFLHTDKSTYLAGENIWYKAYVTLDGLPSYLSKIVYLDLVDEKGKVVEKQMRPVNNGASSGDIVLPKGLPTGNYSINAYSLWMLNYKPFIFNKPIAIYNYDYKPEAQKKEQTDFTVNFFPEGGDLVESLTSHVGFFVVDGKGLPIAASGNIQDQSGKKITSFSTVHPGYGKFELTPSANQMLSASVSYNGVEKKFQLPNAKKEGITLSVNNANANRTFVQVNRNVLTKATYNELLVLAQMHGKPVFIGAVNFSEDATGMSIVKNGLPPGIMHISVFDLNGKPLAERLAFVSNYEVPNVIVTNDSISLKPRGKNKFKVDLSKFTEPSVSVAITDIELTGKPLAEDNILSNLLLTSDLKGFVYQPGYYFQNKKPDVLEHLDLLMMTHGWRRFNWDNVINKKDVALKYPVESGISISGKVTVPQSNKTVAGGHVDIITKGEDSTTILSKAIVNSSGNFLVNDLNFKHKATVYLQGSKSENQNTKVDVIVNKGYIDTLKFSENRPAIDLDTLTSNMSQNSRLHALIMETINKNKVTMLEGVTITAKRRSRGDSLAREYVSDQFQMGQTFELTSSHYLSIWQFLREQVNGLVVEGDLINPNVYFTRFAGISLPSLASDDQESTNQAGGIETNGVTYYLNEINVSKDVVSTIHPSDVVLVKVFKGPEGAALGMSEGGIAIYTKKGIPVGRRPGEKGFFTEQKLGYTVTREFFNPDYSVAVDSSFKDNRTTLYWNGNLKRDQTGWSTIRFYNNDVSKKYKVTIQGIDKIGEIILKEIILE